MCIEIKSRFTGAVLFAHECINNSMRITLEAAVKSDTDLRGANLSGAYLRETKLGGAHLNNGEKLIGIRPILQIGPIGSRSEYLVAYLTDLGLRLRTGCFFGSREEFERKLTNTHGDNNHAREYRAALAMIDAHAGVWT